MMKQKFSLQNVSLPIGVKILLGYIPLLILIFAITIFTLYRLNQVNQINNEIITVDLVVSNIAENMGQILLAQESQGRRYIILKSSDMLSLFWKRDQEFIELLRKMNSLSMGSEAEKISILDELHSEYNKYFQSGIAYLDSTSSSSFVYADSIRQNIFEKQVTILRELGERARKNQVEKTRITGEIGTLTYRTVTFGAIFGITLVIGIALLITRSILKPIKTLKKATNFIAQGQFQGLPTVHSKDELGDLSFAFNKMAVRLVQLEEVYMDSSPLTRLPGGIAIENTCIKKIENNEPFAFCMMDLDNFKPFNDRYGYSRGNSVIKNTAKIIQQCTNELGNPADFVGHIGGDDYALITTPDKFSVICEKIISLFDEQILSFYNTTDREQGYIVSKSRRGEELKFPIMTISISALNSEKSYVENYIQVGEIIAELKKYAKTFTHSNLVVDRRGGVKRKEHTDAPPGDNQEETNSDE